MGGHHLTRPNVDDRQTSVTVLSDLEGGRLGYLKTTVCLPHEGLNQRIVHGGGPFILELK